jgi:2-methylaconitate cis-trans-isomerase PrpF
MPADETFEIPCSIIRGGTSRAVFFKRDDLPYERPVVDRLLLNVFGSPDPKQTNGLGGATSQTSKAAIIGPPSRPDADVDYTFAQVSITEPMVDWGGNCGNISSGVGPYAINAGFVEPRGDQTVVRIHNTNTGKIIVATVPTAGRRAATLGEHRIDGVPGTGPHISLEFEDPSGAVTGKLLPTGNPWDTVTLADGRVLRVSVVDATNPTVFVEAAAVGLRGTELPAEMEADVAATAALEEARGIVAAWLGLVDDPARATALTPALPKVGIVRAPVDYETSDGVHVAAGDVDLVARLMSMQRPHRAYMVTGGSATAVAALIDGTVVHDAARRIDPVDGRQLVRIGHPSGTMAIGVAMGGPTGVRSVTVSRTARAILDGVVHVPRQLLDDGPHGGVLAGAAATGEAR